jgi:hypothetical protein
MLRVYQEQQKLTKEQSWSESEKWTGKN